MIKSSYNPQGKSILNKLKRKKQITKDLPKKKSRSPGILKDVAYRKLNILTKWKGTLGKFQDLK